MPHPHRPARPDDSSTPHRTSPGKSLAAVVAVALVPLALVVGHLPDRAGQRTAVPPATTVSTPGLAPTWLAVQTGYTSKITLNTVDGQQGAAQTLAPAANCGVTLGPAASQLLTLRGSTGGAPSESLASYAGGSIGVKEKKSGTSCSQVGAPSESLELGLGPAVRTALGPDTVATSAYLDVELKGGARILATAKLGTAVVGTFELQSGYSIGKPPVASTPPFVCPKEYDSRSDHDDDDNANCRWPISAPSWLAPDDGIYFDTLTLAALSGSFSLEGGSDGSVRPLSPLAPPKASILEIAADTVGCGAATDTEAAAGAAPEVTVHRLENVGATPCAAVPYSLSTSPGSAQFLKPLNVQPTAQFVWDVTSRFPSIPGTTVLPDIKIDYETPDAAGASPLVPLGWCPDADAVDDPAQFAGYTPAQVATLPDQDDFTGTQFACVISRTAQAVAGDPDQVQVRDLVYVYGDARMQW